MACEECTNHTNQKPKQLTREEIRVLTEKALSEAKEKTSYYIV